jgi:hypothetical protein
MPEPSKPKPSTQDHSGYYVIHDKNRSTSKWVTYWPHKNTKFTPGAYGTGPEWGVVDSGPYATEDEAREHL